MKHIKPQKISRSKFGMFTNKIDLKKPAKVIILGESMMGMSTLVTSKGEIYEQ